MPPRRPYGRKPKEEVSTPPLQAASQALAAAPQGGAVVRTGVCRLPQRLKKRWDTLRQDPEYLSAQDALATLAVLRGEYEARLPECDSPGWRKQHLKDLCDLQGMFSSGSEYEDCQKVVLDLVRSCQERVREDEVVKEIVGISLAENTIKSVEMRRVEKGGQTLTVQESLSLLQECADIVDAVASDPVKKAWGMRRLSAMMARKAQGGVIYSERVPRPDSVGMDEQDYIPRAAEPEG